MSRHYFESICEHLHPCATKWKQIARFLDFTDSEISQIALDPQNLVANSFLDAVIGDWLKREPGDARGNKTCATLEKLITAVNAAGFVEIGSHLTLGMYNPQEIFKAIFKACTW